MLSILCCAGLLDMHNALASLGDESSTSRVAESYILPISPPTDQGDSGLCWVYAALSMLETNYMVRHPGSKIALSRGALQLDAVADRMTRLIQGESGGSDDGGLAVEALKLIRQDGLVARRDFHPVEDSGPIATSIERKLARATDPGQKREILARELKARLGAIPEITHLDGRALSPEELARTVLGDHHWIEFDRSRDGFEGWGPSRDPDARPDTEVMYVKLDRMIELIHRSLANGKAVVWGTKDHALLIYGGEYDRAGRPIFYWIKDSFAPYAYRASAESIHRVLNDVTVEASLATPEL